CLFFVGEDYFRMVGKQEVTLPTGRSELGVLVLENGDSGNYLKS
ncbi:MAG: hypothetical protein JWQ49_5766, partial [Edaphobacter sp.]|nr:hypothetical protein [Edaphobacter sp.]